MSSQASNVKPEEEHLDDRVSEWMRVYGALAVFLIGLGAGALYGPAIAVLVFAAGVMVGAIATFWTSLRALFGETRLTGEDAYALGAPTAEEEQKRAVLRAIKDIEFERRVGKISEEDFQYLYARYRAEAKRLLRRIDEKAGPQRAKVEKLVSKHLEERGFDVAAGAEADGDADDDASRDELEPAHDEPPSRDDEDDFDDESDFDDDEVDEVDEDEERLICPNCGAANEPDAAFCKKCGKGLDEDADDDDDDADDEEDADDDDADDDDADDEEDEA